MRSTLAFAVAVATVLGPTGIAAQDPIDRDVEFVRSLARKLGFISLAQSQVERMKTEYKDRSSDFQQVAQLGIEISLIGAKIHPNREEKRTLFKKALEDSRAFLERYSTGKTALAARITLADATMEFGRFLAEEIELARAEAPDQVADFEKEAADVFKAGVDACDQAMRALREVEDDQQAKVNYHLSWLRKGILLREHARAVKKDRGYLTDRSRETLEELVFEVGEETLLGMTAMFEYTQNDEVVGKFDAAIDGYRGVIDNCVRSLTSEEFELPAEVRERMVVMMESGYDRLAQTMLGLGRSQDVVELGKQYRKQMTDLGVKLTEFKEGGEVSPGREDERFGHSFYITEAMAMADTGDATLVQRALAQVKYFNDQHPNDYVGLRAKTVLKGIMDAQSQVVSGALLLEVALGDFQRKEYELAIQGAKKALAAMSASEAAARGCEAYNLMARSFISQQRFVEATLALKTGLEKYGTTAGGEAQAAASLIQRTMRQIMADTSSDKFFEGLSREIDELAIRYGGEAEVGKRAWQDGLRRLSEKRYGDAVREFEKVPVDQTYYEWAQARIVACFQLADQPDQARAKIRAYREWLKTPAANIPADRNDKEQVRELALAEVAFYEGYVMYEEASGKYTNDKKDATKFPEVIKLLSDFQDRYGKVAPNLVPRVHYVLGRAYLEIGDLDKAEEKYRTMKGLGRNSAVPILATAIFNTYNDLIRARQKEVDALYQQDDKDGAQKAQRKLDDLYRRAVALGLDYFQGAEEPQYGIGYLTLTFAEELRDWPRVESFGTKLVEMFGDDKEVKERVDKFVRAIVGRAVLQQNKYREAYDMLIQAETADPKNYPIKRLLCLTLGGWAEFNSRGELQRYPGLGKPDEAWTKYWTEYKPYGLNPNRGVTDYSLEWYKFYWECYWFARQARKKDSAYEQRAKSLYGIARSTDEFEKLKEYGRAGRELRDLFLDNPPD